jgi:hypothetical protein
VCLGQKPEIKKDGDTNRIAQLINHFEYFSSRHIEREEIVSIFIDGLDDVKDLNSFLGILPSQLPPNIVIVFSCTSKGILPDRIGALIEEHDEIHVEPLNVNDCAVYIMEQLPDLEPQQARVLAEKSEGLPLYLRYLIEYIKTQEDLGDLNNWLDTIPIIHGKIKNYYEAQVWSKIKDTPHKVRIALTIAQLREPVHQEELRGMLPDAIQLTFTTHFPQLVFLLKKGYEIGIYHNSFSEFINEKAKYDLVDIHSNIAQYCTLNKKSEYSIAHKIHHISLSNTPERAISECTQVWADICALHDVEPDLVLYDIQQVQGLCIDAHKTVELIKVKLLLSRISFRYNEVFKENAAQLAEALIAIGRPKAVLKYVLRGNEILTSDSYTFFLVQQLYDKEAISEARKLYLKFYSDLITDLSNSSKEGYFNINKLMYLMNIITLSTYDGDNQEYAIKEFSNRWSFLSKLKKDSREEVQKRDIDNLRTLVCTVPQKLDRKSAKS